MTIPWNEKHRRARPIGSNARPFSLEQTARVLAIAAMLAVFVGTVAGLIYTKNENGILRAMLADVPER